MIPQELIRLKRDGGVLTGPQIQSFLKGYVEGSVAEYHMSAMAMAIFFRGLNKEETTHWLKAMVASGKSCQWQHLRPQFQFVDKHSTGGVGDKTSLVILPLLVAEGLKVPMISGRGLGHTGGTLDKLESIPGFSPHLTFQHFCQLVETLGGAFGAQTPEFVPADKKLYALRDVTATVESQALISASIMSKKIAEDLDVLVLDVKCGDGAFMKTPETALQLATGLTELGNRAGCKTIAAITNMDEPLGRSVGNALEVIECFEVLQGKGPQDTRDLSLQLAAAALSQSQSVSFEEAVQKLSKHLESGLAWDTFCRIALAQGAQAEALKNWSWAYHDTEKWPIAPLGEGYLGAVQCFALGSLLVEIGAGRKTIADSIHPGVGLSQLAKVGEWVSGSTHPLCYAHTPQGWTQVQKEEFSIKVKSLFKIETSKDLVHQKPLVLQWVRS